MPQFLWLSWVITAEPLSQQVILCVSYCAPRLILAFVSLTPNSTVVFCLTMVSIIFRSSLVSSSPSPPSVLTTTANFCRLADNTWFVSPRA